MCDNRKSNGEDLFYKEYDKIIETLDTQVDNFLKITYPSYLITDENHLDQYLEQDSSLLLDSMTFFRITQCTIENIDNVFDHLNEKIEKLFVALHSINIPIAYGLISLSGITNLVLGIYSNSDVIAVKNIINGMLSDVILESYTPNFQQQQNTDKNYGILSGIPTVFLREEKQKFTLSSIMRSLNNTNYTILFLSKPIQKEIIGKQIHELINIRDIAFAASKHNISYNENDSEGTAHTDHQTDSITHTDSFGGFAGLHTKVGMGINYSHSYGRNHAEGKNDTISKNKSTGKAVAVDIQNGYALALIEYIDKSLERLKCGQINGTWQTSICYSADSKLSSNIIKACLCSELSKPDVDQLPLRTFELFNNFSSPQALLIPNFFQDNDTQLNALCSCLNSTELALLCTFPTENVPDFELRTAPKFPIIKSENTSNVKIGNVTDGKIPLENMPFGLSTDDLNKHTFVCGITGSGKTTTVKKILIEANKPFMVIESAKKEYRNISLDTTIYTLGKPELNCPQINPFYIMPGVSPQTHIDYLKDLFIASFSFYGPMSYILEKCLHNVYRNKGWNLTLGFHPLLANSKSNIDLFDGDYIRKQYSKTIHKYLFPTMQDLKDEIERFIENEMDYEGEVAGNIKTAIKVRLENLCVGAKGYMFNTHEHLEFSTLLEKNIIFELEGLADDSDKAFCVGLLVIFINEYRQSSKEAYGNKKTGLLHLLVIEEAHRLLKNVDTELSSESIGNPKGKAVEHFTNMIAEMRSYGQGVIVAEQIPSKLAPDVIKNSSNKIIHRIVSSDDQQIVSNTVGIPHEKAIHLGMLETGIALCHKEGMALPVSVKIDYTDDYFVSDELLYNCNLKAQMQQTTLYSIRESLYENKTTKELMLRLLHTLFIESFDNVSYGIEQIKIQLSSLLKEHRNFSLLKKPINTDISIIISEYILNFMLCGLYTINTLPNDEFMAQLQKLIISPNKETFDNIKQQMNMLYGENVTTIMKYIISKLIKYHSIPSVPNIDIPSTIDNYFIYISDNIKNEISLLIKEV